MEIDDMSFDELLVIAAKSEVNAREVYEYLANRSDNFVVTDRFEFLASEEQKHEDFIRDLYKKRNSGNDLDVKKDTPVPMPFIKYDDQTDESEIISQAMEAEIASRDFYQDMADKAQNIEDEGDPEKLLRYLSGMEQNHYEILKSERERMLEFEEFDEYHPAMHMGP